MNSSFEYQNGFDNGVEEGKERLKEVIKNILNSDVSEQQKLANIRAYLEGM